MTERLLTISGEGRIDVDRKHREQVSTWLKVRFVVATNELPRLTDASGALASRFSILKLTNSFIGREDMSLGDRLVTELPGIFNWAVAGWKRLKSQERFSEPASATEAVTDLDAIGSSIGQFVNDCCEVGGAYRVSESNLFAAWNRWRCENKLKEGLKTDLIRELTAHNSKVKRTRSGSSGPRPFTYYGIRLAQTDLGDNCSYDPPSRTDLLSEGIRFGEGEI